MQQEEYHRLWQYEEWYWWYRAQRMNLIDALRESGVGPGARVLDAGCGTGSLLQEVSQRLGVTACGMDVSCHAAGLWPDSKPTACQASVNSIPFRESSFDAVYSVDVLGCRGVNIGEAWTEMTRVLRPGGVLVLLVPAYQWMLSTHDAAVHSVHRFTRVELARIAQESGLQVVRLTHRFPLFFPAIAATRWLRKWQAGVVTRRHVAIAASQAGWSGAATSALSTSDNSDEGNARSDLRPIPDWLNAFLLSIARVEHVLFRRVTVPFGSTILLTARKPAR